MKLTVIILCYNFDQYIEQCIDSVLAQRTNFDFEIIVGDDLSTDKSVEKITKYGDRIKYYVNEVNVGLGRNTRKLVEMASGEYISYLDGDDYFTDLDKLQKQVDFLDANPDFVMHSTGSLYLMPDGNFGDHIVPLYDEPNTENLLNANYVGFGRTFRNLPGVAHEWMDELRFHDWMMNFEISLKGKIRCEGWVGGAYRIVGSGLITGVSQETLDDLNYRCREAIHKRYSEHK
jgi:glycosyltransferase involved in cell wall biosynthesis